MDKLKSFDLNNLLSNYRNIEEYSIDFVYSSAQIEGNSYDKIDTLTLLKYGQTSGGKKFSDAVMLLNLRKSFDFVINNLDSSLNEGELKSFIKDSHAIISKDLVLSISNESGIIINSDVLISGTSYSSKKYYGT